MRPNSILHAHVHNNHNKLHVVNDGRHPRFPERKGFSYDKPFLNITMGCNCANISHKAVYMWSPHSWIIILKCQCSSTTDRVYTRERALCVCVCVCACVCVRVCVCV